MKRAFTKGIVITFIEEANFFVRFSLYMVTPSFIPITMISSVHKPLFPTIVPLILIALLALSSCEVTAPVSTFNPETIPSAPDYAARANWSCLPDKDDFADMTPSSVALPERQAEAEADVFFIHPTTFMQSENWNADVRDEVLNQSTDSRAIKHQASLFNAAGRVYAPRYRQMVYSGFFSEDKASMKQAGEVAYADVKAAFEYYLKHWNHGRPIIIAGHSQGSLHGMHLLKEFFDGTELQSQLVAAYLPGWPITTDFYQHILVSNAPDQVGCVSTWCTFKEGYEPDNLNTWYENAVVTNPVNWKSDGTPATKEEHDGFLMENYEKFFYNAVNTQAHEGILWMSNPVPLLSYKNYHVGDYNLFWLDVRENAVTRVNAYLEAKGQVAEK